jgi:hypothetical protein
VPLRIAIAIDGVLANSETDAFPDAERIENFWESLTEAEPGAVSRLATLATSRLWEIIFLTSRPPTAGGTVQLQSQRWLESKGFALPSVYVAQGPRGRIAAALGLDVVVDGGADRCIDVVGDSEARAILVWRGREATLPAEARRPEISIVKSVSDCLDLLEAVPRRERASSSFLARLKRMLGLQEARA